MRDGFTIVEVVVALGLLMAVWLAAARVLVLVTAANARARAMTQATVLAMEKLEELRAMPIDAPALAASPPDALAANVPGYFDLPDRSYVRRWSVAPLPSHPESTMAIRVVVSSTASWGSAQGVTVKTRKAP
jgi:type II secretory pathway pseudopilin PulG